MSTAVVPRVHLANAAGGPACLQRPRRYVPQTTDDLAEVTCLKCRKDSAMTETVPVYVEPDWEVEPASGFPYPRSTAEALGWEVLVGERRGVVLAATATRMEVALEGECRRRCCLEAVQPEAVRFLGPIPCGCGSGTPEVLCLCEEVEAE